VVHDVSIFQSRNKRAKSLPLVLGAPLDGEQGTTLVIGIPPLLIRIRISKKNRQHNGQKKINKRTNNDLQNIHIKLKEMHKINFLPTKGNACDAVFDLKYKQFDFVLFSVEVKIHVKANLTI
jgi:hypothetical protein